jgi:predicted phage tail protein
MSLAIEYSPNQRLRTIRLYGKLGTRFGRVHRLAVGSAREAVRALGVLHKGFDEFLAKAKDHGMVFAVFYGKRNIGEHQLGDPPSQNDIRIAPIVQGSKSGGVLQTVLGAVLFAAAVYFSGGAAAGSAGLFGGSVGWGIVGSIGISLALGGVAQMIAGTQKGLSSSESADNTPSYNFSGIKNTTTQGNPVPLCYGEMTVGSACVSIGIVAEDQQ